VSGPDEKWFDTAYRSTHAPRPIPLRHTRKCPTCGARVKTFDPSTPVDVSTSSGRSALSAFGFETSALYGSAAPR
jgi:hypothetical protein